jgi:hypothetical protein
LKATKTHWLGSLAPAERVVVEEAQGRQEALEEAPGEVEKLPLAHRVQEVEEGEGA